MSGKLITLFATFATFISAALALPLKAQEPKAPDLQKQVDDALKELDKLKKIQPDDGPLKQFDDVPPPMRRIGGAMLLGPNGLRGGGMIGQGRWGVVLQVPPPVLVDQLQLPPGQGLVVIDVRANSPAAKAGVLKHDILIEVDGKPASSDFETFQREIRDLKADVEIPFSVIRKGKRESIKGMKLPEARADAFVPINPFAPPAIQANPVGNVRVQINANGNEIMKSQVNNDDFNVELISGELRAKVVGKREKGKATPTDISIQDGQTRVSAHTMEQVPERYRPTITRMLETIR